MLASGRARSESVITVSTWHWGEKYPVDHVRRLAEAVRRNLKQPHRFLCITNKALPKHWGVETTPIPNLELLREPGCVVRLRMFDEKWQKSVNLEDRLLNLDLDLVVTGGLDNLVSTEDGFSILQHVNTTNPCPFNGSVMMLRAGYRPDVWGDYSVTANRNVPWHAFPDDQGWLHHKLPFAREWTGEDGVYAFRKRGWPSGDALPAGAVLVAFPGWRDPSKFEKIAWVRENWN